MTPQMLEHYVAAMEAEEGLSRRSGSLSPLKKSKTQEEEAKGDALLDSELVSTTVALTLTRNFRPQI